MNRINIESLTGKKFYTAPSEWNELSRKQLFIWSGIIRQKISMDMVLKAAVIFFYGLPTHLYGLLNEAQKIQLNASLDYLTNGNQLTKNVIGSFRLFFKRYHGPANRLSNLSISEYRRTELYYQLFLRTKDEFYLNLLCATLFRPKGKKHADDDLRGALTELELLERAHRFKWLHPNLKHSILLFYEGCRTYIIKTHTRVFQKSTEGNNKSLFDFEEIILAVSGDKFGTFQETQKTNLYIFLKQLTDRMEEADALKRKRK